VLVVSQLTLAMALLIVSGLLVRGMIGLARTPLGFDPTNVLSLQVEVPEWRYTTDASVLEYYDRLLAGISALPGVASAAAVDRLPVLGGESAVTVDVDGYAPPRPEDRPWAVSVTATETFFDASRVPVIAGRTFTRQDSSDAAAVALVNQTFVRRYFTDPQRAVGARVTVSVPGAPKREAHIVGIVGDVMQPDLTGVSPAIYLSARQNPLRAMGLMVRSTDATALMSSVRGVVRSIDADVAVFQMRTMEDAFDDELSGTRILIGMFISFAVIALVIASAGLYGVISYSVSQRVQEIGIRMALGAVPGDIRRLVARETAVLVAVGAALGLAGGAAIARAAASVLFNVSPTDPPTYIGVAVTLVSIALLSGYLPVRRATRIDPLTALKAE
jgi:putative ABC transport system permease protein